MCSGIQSNYTMFILNSVIICFIDLNYRSTKCEKWENIYFTYNLSVSDENRNKQDHSITPHFSHLALAPGWKDAAAGEPWNKHLVIGGVGKKKKWKGNARSARIPPHRHGQQLHSHALPSRTRTLARPRRAPVGLFVPSRARASLSRRPIFPFFFSTAPRGSNYLQKRDSWRAGLYASLANGKAPGHIRQLFFPAGKIKSKFSVCHWKM